MDIIRYYLLLNLTAPKPAIKIKFESLYNQNECRFYLRMCMTLGSG